MLTDEEINAIEEGDEIIIKGILGPVLVTDVDRTSTHSGPIVNIVYMIDSKYENLKNFDKIVGIIKRPKNSGVKSHGITVLKTINFSTGGSGGSSAAAGGGSTTAGAGGKPRRTRRRNKRRSTRRNQRTKQNRY